MTEIISVGSDEVRSLISMPDAIAAIRSAFLALGRDEFEMPVRTVLADGRFLVMSAHHRPTGSAMIKSLSVSFDGRAPAIVGAVVWTDLRRSSTLVADAPAVTALRTGAAVGVATDLLASVDAQTCALIGTGAQARDQIRAVHAVRPLTALRIVGRDLGRAELLATAIQDELGIAKVRVDRDADEAVSDAAIVCCATTTTAPLFDLDSLLPDAHVNAIGSYRPTMRELPDELLAAATIVIDDKSAVLQEAGDVIDAIESGAVTESELIELSAALAANAPRGGGRTVFKSVGVAVQDWALARLLAERLLV